MPAGSTYTPIATTTLGSAQSSVTFNSFSGYTDLVIVAVIGNSANANRDLYWTYNGDSATNYSSTSVGGDGSSAFASRDSNKAFLRLVGSSNNTPTNMSIIQIMNYSNTTTFKTCLFRAGNPSWVVTATAGLWRSTSAITSITFTNESAANFVTGSTFTLYGIASA